MTETSKTPSLVPTSNHQPCRKARHDQHLYYEFQRLWPRCNRCSCELWKIRIRVAQSWYTPNSLSFSSPFSLSLSHKLSLVVSRLELVWQLPTRNKTSSLFSPHSQDRLILHLMKWLLKLQPSSSQLAERLENSEWSGISSCQKASVCPMMLEPVLTV